MAGFIDLHVHSTASDGSMKPSELIRYGKEKGLAALALTDHDTMDGVDEAVVEGKKIGLEVIAGVEISVEFEPEMHILGYFFKDTYRKMDPVLAELRQSREARNLRIVDKLNEMGFDISIEEVLGEARGKVVGRAHISSVLYKKGYVSSMKEAFDKYLASGREAYFKREKLFPQQGIKEILKADGVPVLAHPIYLNKTMNEIDDLLAALKGFGLMGIEAYYVDNSPDDTENLLRLAEKHGLAATGGTDFHGVFKSGIEIGIGRGNLRIPYELLEKLKQCR